MLVEYASQMAKALLLENEGTLTDRIGDRKTYGAVICQRRADHEAPSGLVRIQEMKFVIWFGQSQEPSCMRGRS